MSKKQDTLWTAFGRQCQPPTKRMKLQMLKESDTSVPRRKQRGDSSGDDEDAGTWTDADLLSSQEDTLSAEGPNVCDGGAFVTLETRKKTASAVVTTSQRKQKTEETPRDELKLHERKEIKDSVHGLMTFEPVCMRIIDTLQFQRLRSLHQLGAANFVYIGATHSRFEHCLGVAYLAEKMVESIRSHQPWLPITKEDVTCIKIAALCHDLGHGPFSHVFDGLFLEQLRKNRLIPVAFKWSLEQGSVEMLAYLLAENKIRVEDYGLTQQDVIFIKELVWGGPLPDSDGILRGRPSRGQRFLYDIVNNARSGLDVDKLDYFMRDSLHTGAKMSCDTDLLIRNARVLVDREDPEENMVVCFPEKLAGQIMQAFRTRYELHQSVYQHRGVRAIDYMLCDLMISANDHLTIQGQRISEIMCSMDAYQHFDDRVLLKIQESDTPELQDARTILNRIYSKPYYNFVGKTALTDHSQQKTEDMLLNEVLRCSTHRTLINDKDAVILEFMRAHYGKGKEDPLQHVRFYSKNSTASSRCFRLPECAYEMFSPRKFEEFSIRVFVKQPHLASHQVAPVREAFERWCRKFNNSQVFPLEFNI
ncbi:HD domain-containing protein [Phytophthora infestans]|uniref:HD domain-containing protein n=1 Tax=Phytophthora infestans TaxID=4787 RepID=A0A833SDU9_PHYIN|nr:HD domain-containing protein [Phytophthora infestans]